MNDTTHESPFSGAGQPISRRRLFELGGAAVGVAALLAACSKDDKPEAGRVGNAPVPTDLPRVTVDDNVYLRTMQSVEKSILEVYAVLGGLDGLGQATTEALARFVDDHTATAEAIAGLTIDNGGEPYDCPNAWMMDRELQPALDHVVGRDQTGDEPPIEPTDDVERDTVALVNGLETLASAMYQQMVEHLSTPALRAAVIPFGAQAARRSATIAIIAGGDEDRYVSPELLGEEMAADESGFTPAYALQSRFGRLVPVNVLIGSPNELGLRFTATFETPSNNAYVYADQTCEA